MIRAQPAVQPPAVQSWTESAYDWWQRSKRHSESPPKDPGAAAWAFVRPTSATGTGIAFLDAALRRRQTVTATTAPTHSTGSSSSSLPIVVDIRGDSLTGKTWTVVSLAARFAVATRPSLFPDVQEDDSGLAPQVILLDSNYDVTVPKISNAVRSMLLRKLSSTQEDCTGASQDTSSIPYTTVFENDMKDCLSRIHIATAEDSSGWVPILETIRQQLSQSASDHPTLVLWDGFLSEPRQSEAARMEVIRQLERLLLECSVLLITTTSAKNVRRCGREWGRFVTHRIRLDRNNNSDAAPTSPNTNHQHEYVATVHGAQIPFSISTAGILS